MRRRPPPWHVLTYMGARRTCVRMLPLTVATSVASAERKALGRVLLLPTGGDGHWPRQRGDACMYTDPRARASLCRAWNIRRRRALRQTATSTARCYTPTAARATPPRRWRRGAAWRAKACRALRCARGGSLTRAAGACGVRQAFGSFYAFGGGGREHDNRRCRAFSGAPMPSSRLVLSLTAAAAALPGRSILTRRFARRRMSRVTPRARSRCVCGGAARVCVSQSEAAFEFTGGPV